MNLVLWNYSTHVGFSQQSGDPFKELITHRTPVLLFQRRFSQLEVVVLLEGIKISRK
jgi:hypothetical protein